MLRFVRSAAALLLVFALSATAAALPAAADVPAVYTTSQWLSNMARFIVGATVKVQPLSSWNADGKLVMTKKLPAATCVALDPVDAASFNMKDGRKGLYILYDNLPVKEVRRESLFFDPSTLPFLSQRLLVVLCKLKPENYSFYQRRLAEFQSRLDSTLEVGRSLVPDVKILDLTGAAGPWIRAAAGETVRPPDDLWLEWKKGGKLKELQGAIAEAQKRSWWIVTDVWTPEAIRSALANNNRVVTVRAPERDEDFFTYLHDIYLGLASATTKSGVKR